MSLITGFANQTLHVRPKLSGDDFEGVTYGDPEEFRCRYEPATGLRRTSTGDEVEVESFILTEKALKLEDYIVEADREIRRIEPIVDMGGATIGYEVYV